MSAEQLSAQDLVTRAFFDRPVGLVASVISSGVYDREHKKIVKTGNPGKILQVETPDGVRNYRITLVGSFEEQGAVKVWKGKRKNELRSMERGLTKTYNSRGKILTFTPTQGADNILFQNLENIETGDVIATATGVSDALGVSHGDLGRLTVIDAEHIKFQKLRS